MLDGKPAMAGGSTHGFDAQWRAIAAGYLQAMLAPA
jgi:hypothetical protein